MDNVTNRFVLKFTTHLGRIARLSVPRANAAKDATTLRASMEALAELGIVEVPNKGRATIVSGANLISIERVAVI